MQKLLYQSACETMKAGERAAVTRAWCDLNEELRKLAMRPLPKSVDTSKLQRKSRSATVSPEPVEPGAPV